MYQLFDNLTYTDSIGRTATRGTHIRGAVHIAKSSTIWQGVEEALPLLEAAGGQAKAILAPFPWYITRPCCNDPSHTTNVLLKTYKDGLKKDLGEVAKFIRDVLNNNGVRRHRVLNMATTLLEVPVEVAWADAVTAKPSAYKTILDSIYTDANSILKKSAPERAVGLKRTHSDSGPSRTEPQRDWRPRWSVGGHSDYMDTSRQNRSRDNSQASRH